MKIVVTTIPADQAFTDPVGLPVFLDQRPPRREAGRLDFRLGGTISRWLADGAVDARSPSPTLFTPAGIAFPAIVICGGGNFSELSAPAIQRCLGAITETLLRARAPRFSIAARDFRKALMPARDSAELILRGLAHGAELAGVHEGHTVRVFWDDDEAELLVQELRRFRFSLPRCRDWEIARAVEDAAWNPGASS